MKKIYIILIGCSFCLFSLHAQETNMDLRLDLSECVEWALQNNADLKNAKLSLKMADEEKSSAFTNYFPQISAIGAGFVGAKDVIRGEMEIPMMGALPLSMVKNGVIATITAMQPLYTGGQVINGNKLAGVQQEIRAIELEMTEKDVIQNVHTYYWKLVALRGNVSTLDAAEKQLKEVHQQTEQYVHVGAATRNDLLRVELKQQEIASQRLSLNNGIEVVRMVLAQLCGADLNTFDIKEQNILTPPAPDKYFVSIDQALNQREEALLLDKAVRAQALQVKMERGKNLPSIAIGATALTYNVMDKGQSNVIGLATVSVPISNWWGGTHNIRKAKMALEQSKNTQHDTRTKLQIDILTAWNATQEAYKRIEIARHSVKQAEENLRLSRNQYNAGTIDMTELLDAVTLYTKSHHTLITACADYQSRIAEYQRKTK